MSNFVMSGKLKVMEGTKTYELLNSKDPVERKKGKRLIEFCFKAADAFYEYSALVKLREEYKDVV